MITKYKIVDEENDIYGSKRRIWYDVPSASYLVHCSEEAANTVLYADKKSAEEALAEVHNRYGEGAAHIEELQFPDDFWLKKDGDDE